MRLCEIEKLRELGFQNNIVIINMIAPLFDTIYEVFYKDGTKVPRTAVMDIDNYQYEATSFEYAIKSIKVPIWKTPEEIISGIIDKKIKDENIMI